jgi:hypothetical protein
LERTHVLLGEIDASDPDNAYLRLQGENWSPNGEARGFITEKGLSHTTMCVGDLLHDVEEGTYLLCDRTGWKQIISHAEAMGRKLGKRWFSICVEDHEGDHPCTFSVVEMAHAIREANQSLFGIETPDQLIRAFLAVRGLRAEHWSETGRC